ncbi:MAG: phage integrase N-terminal SAM-like domain-containing protein [Crocinitomicaceae bacterium]|nr:phage integrase N-terminal SAM-like domain-containing protein [Crocinitomicaceae bacterium]
MSELAFFVLDLRHKNRLVAPSLSMQRTIYPYRKATLNDCGGDLTKRWYIDYGIYDHETEKIKRRRNYRLFKWHMGKAERYRLAKDAIKRLNENLRYVSENHPMEKKDDSKDNNVEFHSLRSAMDLILDLKYTVRESRKTHHAFKSHCAKFVEFCATNEISVYNVRLISKQSAQMFVDQLSKSKKSPQTIRNIIGALRAIFNHLIQREIIEENPFSNLNMPKVVKSAYHESYSDDEIDRIKKHCLYHDPYLWKVIQVIFYTFIRPIEISNLPRDCDFVIYLVLIPECVLLVFS